MIREVRAAVRLLAHTNLLNLPAKAARFCTSAASVDEIMEPKESDEVVLQNVLERGHRSVLEHISFTFGISGVSRVTETQMVRHRIASFSVKSGRYTKVKERFDVVVPKNLDCGEYAASVTTGDWVLPSGGRITLTAAELMDLCHQFYLQALVAGIPAEDARYILPQAAATQFMATMNARELLHFFELRCCGKAQWEIREVANQMLAICKELQPTIFAKAGPACLSVGTCREENPCKTEFRK